MRTTCLIALLAASPAPAVARSAPKPRYDFELYDLSDRLLRTKKLRAAAKLVVVDFFALSCAPCRKALPRWIALHRAYRARGLRLLLVVVPATRELRRERRQTRRFLDRRRVPFQAVFDGYRLVAKQYGVLRSGSLRLPQAFLLDRSGKLLLKSAEPRKIIRAVSRRLKR